MGVLKNTQQTLTTGVGSSQPHPSPSKENTNLANTNLVFQNTSGLQAKAVLCRKGSRPLPVTHSFAAAGDCYAKWEIAPA